MIAAARFLLVLFGIGLAARGAEDRSVVVYAEDAAAVNGFEINTALAARMTDDVVRAAAGERELAAAWRKFVSPQDRVGIKISAAGGRLFSSHRAVVDALVRGVLSAGVTPENIVVWDRGDLRAAGFGGASYAMRQIGAKETFDPKAIFTSPLLGKLISGDVNFLPRRQRREREPEQLDAESHFARVLASVTKIINVPVLGSHEGCGLAGALYNATVPNIDNWRRFVTPNGANPYLAELYADERLRPKCVLHLMNALVAQYAGGPGFEPNYAFGCGRIYASTDPVALDATALREVDAWRAQAKLPPLAPRAGYLVSAAQMGLGNFDAEKIELRRAP